MDTRKGFETFAAIITLLVSAAMVVAFAHRILAAVLGG
jgi:hypothetical protein